MYDVKTADGKSVKISREQAREIHQQIEREYLYEDVKSVLELDYPIELDEMQEDKSLDDFINSVIDEYNDVMSEDDNWRFTIENIVYDLYSQPKERSKA